MTEYIDSLVPDSLSIGNIPQHTVILFLLVFLVMFLLYIDHKGWIRKNVTHRVRKSKNRDPKRVFTSNIKKSFSQVCNDRCEGGFFIFRCHNKMNLQGDHWYPHANGGATTSRNLVMLCRACNSRKSNKLPTNVDSFFLGVRRKINMDYSLRLPFNVGQYYPRVQTRGSINRMRVKGNRTIDHINSVHDKRIQKVMDVSED